VISYELYSQIRLFHQERGLNFAQIARELNLDEETVAKWARATNYTKGGGKALVRQSTRSSSTHYAFKFLRSCWT
jgi:orotate phosphoribosyltransferase-like protein